jgi:flagellar biosynthesis protein FlhG
MPSRGSESTRPGRKLGRGLSQVSHVFLSGVERQARPALGEDEAPDRALWMPETGLISITSGEGVRGKTSVASGLGFGLYRDGRRVTIANADSGNLNVLDIAPPGSEAGCSAAVQDATSGAIRLVDLLETSQKPLIKALEVASRGAQFVIVDTPPKGEPSNLIWRLARLVVVLSEPDTDKMRAAYATIKRIHSVSRGGRVGLVVNMVRNHDEAEHCFRKISGVCRRFLKINLRNYGHIVFSRKVAKACETAVPLIQAYPDSKAAGCINSILRLIVMDESAIARRRREVRVKECALKGGR